MSNRREAEATDVSYRTGLAVLSKYPSLLGLFVVAGCTTGIINLISMGPLADRQLALAVVGVGLISNIFIWGLTYRHVLMVTGDTEQSSLSHLLAVVIRIPWLVVVSVAVFGVTALAAAAVFGLSAQVFRPAPAIVVSGFVAFVLSLHLVLAYPAVIIDEVSPLTAILRGWQVASANRLILFFISLLLGAATFPFIIASQGVLSPTYGVLMGGFGVVIGCGNLAYALVYVGGSVEN